MSQQLYHSGIVVRSVGFTYNQMAEFKVQVLIFDFMRRATPVPLELLNHIRTNNNNTASTCQSLRPCNAGNPRNVTTPDPEPGRCRRTDGKKWRCANDAVVDQKYCLKHMHRGKHKAKKRLALPENQPNCRRLKTIANNKLDTTPASREQFYQSETPAFNNNWQISRNSDNSSTPRLSLQLDDASNEELPLCMLSSNSHLLQPKEEGFLLSSDTVPSPSSRSTEELPSMAMAGNWALNWNIPAVADESPLAEVVLQSSFSNAAAGCEQWDNAGFVHRSLSPISGAKVEISSSYTTTNGGSLIYDSSSGSSTFRMDPLISDASQ